FGGRLGTARLRVSHRKANADPCALPSPAALRVHRPAVHLDEMADDGEAQPQTALGAARRAVRLPEAIEDVRQEVRRDADPGVADDDLDLALPPLQFDRDLA